MTVSHSSVALDLSAAARHICEACGLLHREQLAARMVSRDTDALNDCAAR